MRDKLKSLEYFNSYIKTFNESIYKQSLKVYNDEIKINRLQSVKKGICDSYLKLLRAKYSRGDDMNSKSVLDNYHEMILLMNNYWTEGHLNKIQYKKNNKLMVLNQYSLSSFLNILDILSLGVLINISSTDFKILVNLIDNDNVLDFLFDFLIRSKVPGKESVKNESYKDYFGINEKYNVLKEIIFIDDRVLAQKKLKMFLENDWYNSFKNESIYGLHTSEYNVYNGYWCFVSAAIVKIKNLDDSSFRDNQYYPKDLV
ncbi:PoNe immunity protein domain-containing protein [Psychroserpens damuponensis]|uniref:PoNe immunity protein domain-containing protein n=1 Tax=Psychroserpens damuponensis TaxID=943936 RepID=UPI00058BF9E4|nr:PoNe immunity protein domain-containing protein [Psychroserpens damuponensis]